MNIKRTSILLALIALTSSTSFAKSLPPTINPAESKGTYESFSYVELSKEVSFGCELTYDENETYKKELIIRVASEDYLSMPGDKVGAEVKFDGSKTKSIDGKATKTTEAKFRYELGKTMNMDVYEAIQSMLKSNNVEIKMTTPNEKDKLLESFKMPTKKKSILKIIDICAATS